MKKILICATALFCCTILQAIETATVSILKIGEKTPQVKTVKLKEIENGVWRLKIPTCEIPRDTKLIDVCSDWGLANKGDEGYFVTPSGHMGTFKADSGEYHCRDDVYLKMYGIKSPKGTFLAIFKGLEFEQNFHVEVKDGVYKMYSRCRIDKIEFDPYEDLIIDFYKLEGDMADYSGMAKTYRKYQLDRKEVIPLKERIKNNPTLDFTSKSIYVRIKLGRCDRREFPYEQWGKREFPIVVDHTFDGVQDIMNRMKNLGMDDVEVCLVGWLKGGHDGPFPDFFPIPEEFGGEQKMVETIAKGKELGYQMTVHVNHTSFYPQKAKRLPMSDVCKGVDGEPRKYTFWPGGQAYFSCFQTICNRLIDEDLAKFKSMGINGAYHVDVTSARPPIQCHDPMHPNNKKQMAQWQNKVNQKCRDAFGAYSSERAMDHVAKTLDYGLYVTFQGSETLKWGKLIDRPLPMIELVYHGIILTNPFYSTIDAPYEKAVDKYSDEIAPYSYLGSVANRRLKVVEFGGRPSFYYVDYKDLNPLKSMYDEYQTLKRLQFEFMEHHSEIAKDVFLTEYGDGTRIICNYRETPYKFADKSIAPKGYAILESSVFDKMANLFK